MFFYWFFAALAVLAALYGLHRLMLVLERCDWRSSWRQSSGSGGYNPLLEIYQPQVRHVVQVEEQRLGDEEDDGGAPSNPSDPDEANGD